MIKHVVMFTWAEDTTPAQVAEIQDALRALPGQIPSIRSYDVGSDLGLADGNHAFGLVAEFDDADGWREYQDHPAHQAVIHDLIRPARADRAALQFEV